MKKGDGSFLADTATPRGRGRPRTFDRNEALGQATLLFWRKGYDGTSIVDLTNAIGIEAPSLYAAFGSKRELFAQALCHYGETYQGIIWDHFHAATTARDAVRAYLADSAAALTGTVADVPRGCMAALSAVTGDVHPDLGELVRSARAVAFDRLEARIAAAVAAGELARSVDIPGLARFVQTVQSGMSILARDGADRSQLETVAKAAMMGWDGFVGAR